MNKIERFFYNKLIEHPRVKKLVSTFYQYILFLLAKKTANYTLIQPVELKGYFFGFHDKIPWDASDSFLLAHKLNSASGQQQESQPISIGLFSSRYEFTELCKTNTWNWQQGSMLQWVGKRQLIAFNDFIFQEITRVFNVQGNEVSRFPGHCSHFSQCGKKYLSFSFARLGRGMKGYGYSQGAQLSSIHEQAPSTDGLWLYDTAKNTSQLLISLQYLSTYQPTLEMGNAFHFVTHANFSPSEKYISFMHRWKTSGNLRTRLYVFNQETRQCDFFAIHDASHIAWNPDDTLTIFGWNANQLACYMKLNPVDMSIAIQHFDSLDVDGHPQVNGRGEIITDTYPDRHRQQKLYWVLPDRKPIALASLFIPFKFRGEKRCDFHPRWNRNGTKICFDSAHAGERSLCVMDLSSVLPHELRSVPN